MNSSYPAADVSSHPLPTNSCTMFNPQFTNFIDSQPQLITLHLITDYTKCRRFETVSIVQNEEKLYLLKLINVFDYKIVFSYPIYIY